MFLPGLLNRSWSGRFPEKGYHGRACEDQRSGKLALLYERFRDVCWLKRSLERNLHATGGDRGPVRTNIQDRYEVEINDPDIERALEANISGEYDLGAAIDQYRAQIVFLRKGLKSLSAAIRTSSGGCVENKLMNPPVLPEIFIVASASCVEYWN